jgi:long-chain fatty acid transport protein
MKKLLTISSLVYLSGVLFAGGLVTNTNQSAAFTRLQCRDATLGIDAVYYNPAGLTKLADGFHLSISNQSISQTQTIISSYTFLKGKPKTFQGDVSAPLFPGVYAAYKTGKLAFSFGFNPIGGGGGAEYKTGLPSFENQVAELVPLLASKGFPTTAYDANIYFKGSSIYFGYQGNVSYAVNDMISVAAGLRYVTAKNTYEGYLKKISVNPTYPAFGATFDGSMVLASDFFTAGAATLNGLAAGATAFATGLTPIVAGGGGPVLLANGTTVGLTAIQVGQIQQILGAAGLTPAQIGAINIATAQGTLSAAAPAFTTNATTMTGYAKQTSDVTVDASESGSGITPIISANFSPSDKLNIAVKYEFKTKLELTQKVVNNNGGGIFTEGTKVIADMPAQLVVGLTYKPMEKLMVSTGAHYYFDKNVDYDKSSTLNVNMIDKNFVEYALGLQYSLTDKLAASAGWLTTMTGVNSLYQDDLSYSLNTNTFGAGIEYRLNDMIALNLAGSFTNYKDGKVDFTSANTGIPYTLSLDKKVMLIAVGVDLSF